MTPEERMLERFTKERQRESKGALFNLEEDDDLTHYGQSLSKLDDFDNIGLGLDDDDDGPGQIDSKIVQKAHFGGFESDEDDEDEGVSGMGLLGHIFLLDSLLFPARAEENKSRGHGRSYCKEQGAQGLSFPTTFSVLLTRPFSSTFAKCNKKRMRISDTN